MNKMSTFEPSRLNLQHADSKNSVDSKDSSSGSPSFRAPNLHISHSNPESRSQKPPLSNSGTPRKSSIKLGPVLSARHSRNNSLEGMLKEARHSVKSAKALQINQIPVSESTNLNLKALKIGYANSDAPSPMRTFEKLPSEHRFSTMNHAVLAQKLEGITNTPGSVKKSKLEAARHLDSSLNSINASKRSLFSAEGGKRPQSREHSQDTIFRISKREEEKKTSFLRENFAIGKYPEGEIGLKPLPQTQTMSKTRSKLAAVLQSQQNLHDTLMQGQNGEAYHSKVEKVQQSPTKNAEVEEDMKRASRVKEGSESKQKSVSVDRNCGFVLRNEKQLGKSSRKDSEQMNNSNDDKSLSDSLKVMKFEDNPQQEAKGELELKTSQPKSLFGFNNNKVTQFLVPDVKPESTPSVAKETSTKDKSSASEVTKKENETFGKLLQWKMGGEIGSGSFGQVYKAMDIDTGKIIAVKKIPVVDTLGSAGADINAELTQLKKCKHPNIVQFIGSETLDNVLYIYMEYVAGGSITSIYEKYGPLPEKTIKVYAKQILAGLEYLHENEVIHRDIKGSNILIHKDGTVKLADFGCSTQLGRTVTGAGDPIQRGLKGSVPWMAPETANETGSGRRSDIWSFGCTVLEMATAQAPWSQYNCENPVTLMVKIALKDELPAIPDSLSEDLKDFIRVCLRRKPEERPQAKELLKHKFLADS